MMESDINNSKAEETGEATQPGWSKPLPEHLSHPSYWPAMMALGITALFWGIVTSVIMSIVGLALFALALAGWIGELLHESPER